MSQTRAQIKSNIDSNITTNGQEEITGAILRSVLNNMADNLATEYAGYQYAGVATPSTNPGTPDGKVFYLASTAGTYTSFGSLTVAEGEVAVLKYNGSTWSKDNTGVASQAELNQLGQEIGAEIITPYELVVSSSSQSKRIDFAKAQKGRFEIAFDGGRPSVFACKVVLYNGSTAAQNLVWESEGFGFNKGVEYSGNEFDIAVFTVYGDMVVTAGEAHAVVELGILSKISSLEERIDAGEKSDFSLMVKTHGYNLSGNPVLDENGLLVQSGVIWGDGSAGTLTKTNFNEDVLDYSVETITHAASSKTVQYSYQFSELGEVTIETINIS